MDERTGGVKGEDGGVIRGLYAAGRTAVGVCSRQYVSGLSIADCVYSGRRAGRAAARGEVLTIEQAPKPTQTTPVEAKPLIEGIPVIREAQVADPTPEAHQGPTRRQKREGVYPRQSLNRTIRRPGGTTRVSSQRGRLTKRAR